MFYFKDVSMSTAPNVIGRRVLPRRGIVLHETIGTNSLSYLQGGSVADGRRVSCDYLIGRKGNIWQITPPGYYGFHSGIARHGGYQEKDHSINQGYVGIEFENKPALGQEITTEQYIAGAFLIRRLCSAWPIPLTAIVGHSAVALPVGRKTDPITLNWVMLTNELIYPSVESHQYVIDGELS